MNFLDSIFWVEAIKFIIGSMLYKLLIMIALIKYIFFS
jgi:hypothetical protein